MATRIVRQHLENVAGSTAAKAVVRPEERKSGFLSRVAYTLRRVSFGWSFAGLFLPVGPAYRLSNTLSPKEKAEIDAYRMGL
jgi:hypothetical protein